VEKLLRAKDFQEAVRIQVEYLQSQLKAAAEDASQIGTKIASLLNRSRAEPYRGGPSRHWIKNRNHPAMDRVKNAFS
jgi:hypothetical protein